MRLNAALGCSSSAALLFESPTIAQIANELAGQEGMAEGSPPPPALEAIPVAPYSPEQRLAGLPCSFNQEQMIAISLQPSGLAYNQFFVFELAGMVSAEVLQKSLDVVVARHEALRTCFHMTPTGPQQLVLPAGRHIYPVLHHVLVHCVPTDWHLSFSFVFFNDRGTWYAGQAALNQLSAAHDLYRWIEAAAAHCKDTSARARSACKCNLALSLCIQSVYLSIATRVSLAGTLCRVC